MTLKEDAVSPVVGVMLMLVVTIVIAAIVSAFAGGIPADTAKPPQVTLSVAPAVDDLGIVFRHTGGDAFALKDISVQLQSLDATFTIDSSALKSSTGEGYFSMVGGGDDTFIQPGDAILLEANSYQWSTDEDSAEYLVWKPVGAPASFEARINAPLGYKVIDKKSGKTIQSGSIILR
jgi:FlaG/FlaF family flagellin (archaellin)